MDSNNEDEWSDFLKEIQENVRVHAGYFSWEGNRVIEEAGVVQCLSESLENKEELFFHSYKSRKEDPPDCEAQNKNNETIGIEVTELVDGNSIAKSRQNKIIPWEPWSIEKLDQTIQKRINKKDNPTEVKGGPYIEYILIIYCAEPAILDVNLIEHIKEKSYGLTKLITRVFFLMSYSAFEKCCPYLELKLKNA